MGYEDETERSLRRRSRARQSVGRTEYEKINQRKNDRFDRKAAGPDLITDSFSGGGRSRRQNKSDSGNAKNHSGQWDIYGDPAKKKAKKRKRRIKIIILEVIVLIGILVFAGYSYVNSRLEMVQRLPWDPDEVKNLEISEEKQEQMLGYWTIAIFGVDSRNSSVGKGNNSDVNILCNINQETGEIRLVSVFRDTYLNISDKNSYNKINAAYLQGGPEQAVKAMNKNLDLDIDDYATFNWKAVADAINLLGGIDVEISKAEFYYINAFISETVKATGIGSTQLKSAGMNHLDGVQAVAYGRLRLMDTDYARTERQRKVISLAFEKLKKADWATVNNVIQTVFPQVATSVDMGDLLTLGRNVSRYHLSETTGFPTERKEINMGSKGACVIPNTLESNVTELHQFLFGDQNYIPTDTVKTISNKIMSDAGQVQNGKPNSGRGETSQEETTVSAYESLEESLAEESRESESGESGASGGETGASRETMQETDSQGNLILGPGAGTEWGESRPGSSGTGSTERESEPSSTGALRPGSTEYESAPAPTESQVPRPGTGNETQPSATGQTERAPVSGNNGPAAPGSGGTGVIIAPGGTVSDSGNSTPNVEFSGPMGN